jgi:hypothetical protein
MLWLDLGLGKTVSSLTAAADMMNTMQVYGVLVLAPLRVCQTVWAAEAAKWDHTKHLSFGLVHGKPAHKEWVIRNKTHFYLLNYEGSPDAIDKFITFYLNRQRPLPFNMVVFDEITKLKSSRADGSGGAWGRALSKILPYIPYRVGLTATPGDKILDLFGQYLMIDDGERLGHAFNNFQSAYFTPDGGGYKYNVLPEGEKFIKAAISDITIQMDADDYLDLPDNQDVDIVVRLDEKSQKQYDKLEKDMFLELDSGNNIEPENRASLMGKCLQMASGAVYTDIDDRTKWDVIHKHKVDALIEALESLNGAPLLIGYQFRHEVERIKKRLTKEKIHFIHFDRHVKGSDAQQVEKDWNAGRYTVMLGHHASVGHGLNLQYGCSNVCWFGMPWSLEGRKQFEGRVKKRQGQKNMTTVIRILVEDTVDFAVLEAQNSKAETEADLKNAISSYRKQKFAA